ncbi:hypothetical protein [Sinorhizobium medicae]
MMDIEVVRQAGVDLKGLLFLVAHAEDPTLVATAVIGAMCSVIDMKAGAPVSPNVLRSFAAELDGVAARLHGGSRA